MERIKRCWQTVSKSPQYLQSGIQEVANHMECCIPIGFHMDGVPSQALASRGIGVQRLRRETSETSPGGRQDVPGGDWVQHTTTVGYVKAIHDMVGTMVGRGAGKI